MHRGICMSPSIGIYWGISCITTQEWSSLVPLCGGCTAAAMCVNAFTTIQPELQQGFLPRTPVSYTAVDSVTALAVRFNKRQAVRLYPRMICTATSSSSTSPACEGQSFLPDKHTQYLRGEHCDYAAWRAPKLLLFTSDRKSCRCGLALGGRGREQPSLWCSMAQHTPCCAQSTTAGALSILQHPSSCCLIIQHYRDIFQPALWTPTLKSANSLWK